MTPITAIRNDEAIAHRLAATSGPAQHPSRVASNQRLGSNRKVPMFIPEGQVYYWSSEWQQGEAESLANLRAGRSRAFAKPLDAIRHLLSDDD